VDLGGTSLRVGLVDADGRLVGSLADHTPKRALDGVNVILNLLGRLLRARRLHVEQVAAIGIAVPGPADARQGILLTPPNLPGWRNAKLAATLRERTGRPAHLENDANLAAFGEWRRGAGRGHDNLVYITVSTGVGGGLVLGGRLHSGVTGTAGEIGHVVVDPVGPRCTCGSRGCLETVASGTGLARRAQQAARAGEATAILRAAGGRAEAITAEVVTAMAAEKDRVATRLLEEAAEGLGTALGMLANLLDPGLVVIGGGVALNAWSRLVVPARQRMRRIAWERPARAMRVVKPALGERSGLIGAAEWARERSRT
jgi:glucokinase